MLTKRAMRRQQSGKGQRPTDPYLRIMWAAARGVGMSLTAAETELMSLNTNIADRAEQAIAAAEHAPAKEQKSDGDQSHD